MKQLFTTGTVDYIGYQPLPDA